MKKAVKLLSLILALCLMVCIVVACDDTTNDNGGNTDNGGNNTTTPTEHIDYVSQLKLDMTTTSLKAVVTRKNHVDGDTVHFNVPNEVKNAIGSGVLKGRFLAVNTPESTGKIEDYGHTASRLTKNALANAASILIESDNEKWNADSTGGRYMVWVWYKPTASSEYRNLNLELLQSGLALASNTANNRYGEIAMKAFNQAKAEKLYVHSGKADPEVYKGAAVAISMKELRTNINDYNGIKVAVEGVVVQDYSQTVYVEAYDDETETYYGISVYYGFNLSGTGMDILSMGNKVRVVGTVQYYETGGTWQISDVQYRDFKPDDPNNVKLLEENQSAAYTLVSANDFASKKVTIETEKEDSIVTKDVALAECMLSASISMENLQIIDIYTTKNEDSSSKGAMTFTCKASDGTLVDVRTIPFFDENGDMLTEEDYEGKTINVKGVVDYFSGGYQVKVFKTSDITFVE